jgi:hypothetical protein
MFVLLSTSNGHCHSIREQGGPGDDYVNTMTFNAAGDLFVGGAFGEDSSWDSHSVCSGAYQSTVNGFLVKYGNQDLETVEWVVCAGGAGFESVTAVTTDFYGAPVIAGVLDDNSPSVKVGDQYFPYDGEPGGKYTLFIAHLTLDGSFPSFCPHTCFFE